jgi:hypothetical protein
MIRVWKTTAIHSITHKIQVCHVVYNSNYYLDKVVSLGYSMKKRGLFLLDGTNDAYNENVDGKEEEEANVKRSYIIPTVRPPRGFLALVSLPSSLATSAPSTTLIGPTAPAGGGGGV